MLKSRQLLLIYKRNIVNNVRNVAPLNLLGERKKNEIKTDWAVTVRCCRVRASTPWYAGVSWWYVGCNKSFLYFTTYMLMTNKMKFRKKNTEA